MAAAPETILKGEQYHTIEGENYRYMPGMGAVPEIQAPAFLPDLAGVADLAFAADLGATSIAPSAPAEYVLLRSANKRAPNTATAHPLHPSLLSLDTEPGSRGCRRLTPLPLAPSCPRAP